MCMQNAVCRRACQHHQPAPRSECTLWPRACSARCLEIVLICTHTHTHTLGQRAILLLLACSDATLQTAPRCSTPPAHTAQRGQRDAVWQKDCACRSRASRAYRCRAQTARQAEATTTRPSRVWPMAHPEGLGSPQQGRVSGRGCYFQRVRRRRQSVTHSLPARVQNTPARHSQSLAPPLLCIETIAIGKTLNPRPLPLHTRTHTYARSTAPVHLLLVLFRPRPGCP